MLVLATDTCGGCWTKVRMWIKKKKENHTIELSVSTHARRNSKVMSCKYNLAHTHYTRVVVCITYVNYKMERCGFESCQNSTHNIVAYDIEN